MYTMKELLAMEDQIFFGIFCHYFISTGKREELPIHQRYEVAFLHFQTNKQICAAEVFRSKFPRVD